MKPDCALIVFAKAPVAGYAKTRLAGVLGAQGAAQLAERLLQLTLEHAVRSDIGPVELCCTPDATHTAFQRMAALHAIALTLQGDGDLGARMHRALERALGTCRRAVLIGTDAPGIDALYLRQARKLLAEHDAVFGPALDGGYTLVGLSRSARPLFEGVAWSTAAVMRETRERIAALGLRHAELPPLADVDEPADLIHVPRQWLQPSTTPP